MTRSTHTVSFYSQCFKQFPTSEFIVDGERRFTYAQVR
jgi:hypothetical protein